MVLFPPLIFLFSVAGRAYTVSFLCITSACPILLDNELFSSRRGGFSWSLSPLSAYIYRDTPQSLPSSYFFLCGSAESPDLPPTACSLVISYYLSDLNYSALLMYNSVVDLLHESGYADQIPYSSFILLLLPLLQQNCSPFHIPYFPSLIRTTRTIHVQLTTATKRLYTKS